MNVIDLFCERWNDKVTTVVIQISNAVACKFAYYLGSHIMNIHGVVPKFIKRASKI